MATKNRKRAIIDLSKTKTKFFYENAVNILGTKNTFPEKSRTLEMALEFVSDIGSEIAHQYKNMSKIRKILLLKQILNDPTISEEVYLEIKKH